MIKNISVIGLGKLGLCFASVLQSKGFNVFGYEISKELILNIKKNISPFAEKKLQDLMTHNKPITLCDSEEQCIEKTDLTVLVLPTPSLESGEFSNEFLITALEKCAKALMKKNTYHLFSIISTVSPQSTNNVLIPLIEKVSKKKCGLDFGVCYNPSFIALGSVIKNITQPDFVLLGESDERAGEQLLLIYTQLISSSIPIQRMSIISAEITKIALNAYVTMKISFANFIKLISNHYSEADAGKITQALGSDRRIGHAFLRPGTPYGGPCFPRDNRCFAKFVDNIGLESSLALATDKINNLTKESLIQNIISQLNNKSPNRVVVYGIAYKKDTTVCEESFALDLLNSLSKLSTFSIAVFDEMIQKDNLIKEINLKNVHILSELSELKDTDCLILCHQIDEGKLKSLKCEKINLWD